MKMVFALLRLFLRWGKGFVAATTASRSSRAAQSRKGEMVSPISAAKEEML